MSLRQLSLNNFRNLQPATIEFHPRLNLITGDNASGKSSLLEAINIVCQGQSFRTKIIDQCICHQQSDFLLFAKFDQHKTGFSRTRHKSTIRVDGENINRLSELAKRIPIRTINNESFNLIIGQPGIKRDYLDWTLFHVEQDYHGLKSNYYHALKQRNALLKSKTNLEQLDYWDKYLSEYGIKISSQRKHCLNEISEILKNQFNQMTIDLGLSVIYRPGWNTDHDLKELYARYKLKDTQMGYTRYGVHRDDIEILSNNHIAKEVLSRGQTKRLSIAMILSQIIYLKNILQTPLIVLIDDIASELDDNAISLLLLLVKNLGVQVFITNINPMDMPLYGVKECKMFHVEHGMIKAVKH